MDKEYFIEIDEDAVIYVFFSTKEGEVLQFVVKCLAEFEGEWYEILRYDSGHDCPHKDILDIHGNILRKVWYDFLNNAQAMTMAVTDIKDNVEFYKERYREWLKNQ